jgi:hypothetical protein
MKIEQGFQPSCSETVIKLAAPFTVELIRDILCQLESLTGWHVCLMNYHYYAFFPIDARKVYIKTEEHRTGDVSKSLAADIYSILSIKEVEKNMPEWTKKVDEYRKYMGETDIYLAKVKKDIIIGPDVKTNGKSSFPEHFDKYMKIKRLALFLGVNDYVGKDGFGIGGNQPFDEKKVLEIILEHFPSAEITEDQNHVLTEEL